MVLTLLTAAAMAATTPAPDVRAELVAHDRRDGNAGIWHRYDLRFTNEGSETRTLALCPQDAKLLAKSNEFGGRTRVGSLRADALAFDRDGWRYACGERALAAGENVVLSVYFRWAEWHEGSRRRAPRPILIDTSLGKFFVNDGSVVALAEGDEENLTI